MSYADSVFVKNCTDIIYRGISDEAFNVRPRWHDGTPAHTKKILYQQNRYQLAKDSIPVMTLRKTGFKNAIDEILWIYQKKTSDLSQLHSHIWVYGEFMILSQNLVLQQYKMARFTKVRRKFLSRNMMLIDIATELMFTI